MANSGQYYMNGETLLKASSIFLDEELTIIAPNGYYSDGAWVRLQLDGILYPPTPCPSCLPECGSTIAANGNQGEYVINMNVGGTDLDTGAILIYFDPINIPDGILALFNGVYYNSISSETYGFLGGDLPYMPTFIGDDSYNCNLEGGYFTLNIYEYQNGSFVYTGNNETIYIPAGQVKLTAQRPNRCLMVIPKPNATPNTLNIKFYGPCSGTAFNLDIQCPTKLTAFSGSIKATSQATACTYPMGQTYYNAPVNGTAGVVGMYDFVFADKFGQTKLAAGWYKFSGNPSYNVMQVDANGVVVTLALCT